MATKERLKKYQRAKFENFKKVNDLIINDDEAYIDLKVSTFNSIKAEYSLTKAPILKQEFLDYIENSASYIPLEYPIVLEIHSDKLSSEEKIVIRKLIKNHFTLTKINKEMEMEALNRKSRFFLLIGILGFIILAIFYANVSFSIIIDIISFISSFSIWEFCELTLFEKDSLQEEVIKYTHLAKVRVIFNKDNR